MKKHKLRLDRLERLAAFVEQVKRSRFDFEHFVGDDWKGAVDYSCGTTACAFGWAGTMPYFRKLGLYFTKQNEYSSPQPRMKGKQREFARISQELFGLTTHESRLIFIPSIYNHKALPYDATPKRWAKHVRKFIADVKAGKRDKWNYE